jgi:MFS family permease
MQRAEAKVDVIETRAPARLDRLPWGRFHTLVVIALGVTWVLDGLEVTLTGSIAGALEASPTLHFSDSQVGLASSFYLVGAVIGALLFGWLTDRLGRKILFFVTLGIYILSAAATAFAWDAASFYAFRFLTGAGVGGEYSAVNSTIQEMIPARYRGQIDLGVNGSFWLGGALGAMGAIILLDPVFVDPEIGWRISFLIGAILGLPIFFVRRWLPESPRWLVIHGRTAEAEKIVAGIEADLRRHGAVVEDSSRVDVIRLRPRSFTPLREAFRTMFVTYRMRAFVGLTLMTTQAFFYNAIFFTYALVLTKFYRAAAQDVGYYVLPSMLANMAGPLMLGRLFDVVGRRQMIAFTYATSGLLLALVGLLFALDQLSIGEQALGWAVVFFFASPAAGAAYLTVSETFPVEIRALAIAVFYAVGTAVGGAAAPVLLGVLIESGSRMSVLAGYLLGSGLMVAGAVVVAIWGVSAEGKPLESVARPLSQEEE